MRYARNEATIATGMTNASVGTELDSATADRPHADAGARVRIGSDLYPVIASVSASHTIVEIGREPRVKIGDAATLWDWQPGSRPEDVGATCGASVYDLTMHLNPLLPRRTI